MKRGLLGMRKASEIWCQKLNEYLIDEAVLVVIITKEITLLHATVEKLFLLALSSFTAHRQMRNNQYTISKVKNCLIKVSNYNTYLAK